MHITGVYICMYVRCRSPYTCIVTCVCICIHLYMCTYIYNTHNYMCTYIFTHIYAHIFIHHTHNYMRAYIFTHIYAHIYNTHNYMCTYIYMHICIYVRIQPRTYVVTIYIHIHPPNYVELDAIHMSIFAHIYWETHYIPIRLPFECVYTCMCAPIASCIHLYTLYMMQSASHHIWHIYTHIERAVDKGTYRVPLYHT